MTPERPTRTATWIGLAGYAFFAPASIAASQIFYGLAVAGFIGFLITAKDRRSIVYPPWTIILVIVGYVAYRFLSMIVMGHDVLMIKEDWLFILVVIGAVMFRDVKNLTRVLDIFALGILLMGGYGIWQHFVGVDLYHKVLLDRMVFGYRAIGNFSTYLTFSGFFAITSIFLVAVGFRARSKTRKLYYLLASQVALACILFNYSRSTSVALIIGAVALVLMIGSRYRKWVSLVLLLTLAVGVVVSPDFLNRFKNMGKTEFTIEYANSRFVIWEAAASMIASSPVFGIGPGNFHQKYIEFRKNRTGRDLSHAHNDFLNVGAESGIPCAILFILLWFLVLLYLYKGYMRCPDGFQKGLLLGSFLASVVFVVMAQFEAFFADEEVRLLLMFFWGIGMAVLGNLKASERLSEVA
jgi:O-antigen ligase